MPDLIITDANGYDRVTLGNIGTDDVPDYGLKIVSSDGSTTIIDGTSDVFKIVASGTQTVAFPGAFPANAVSDVTLTGLGSLYTVPPACVFQVTDDNASVLNYRAADTRTLISSAGAVQNRAVCYMMLTASPGTPKVRLAAENYTVVPGTTAGQRYYVLVEAGI